MPKLPKIRICINLQFLKKNVGCGVDVLPADRQESFLQVDSTTLNVLRARHVQSIQNNKFAMPLQYLKENIKDEVDFLPSDKHLSLLQTDTIIVVCGQACQNCPK